MRPAVWTLVGAAVLAASAGADAYAGDGNTIYIRQESPSGSLIGNSLSVDQSQASDSLVVGPSLSTLAPFVGLTLDSAFQGQPKPALQRGEGNVASVTIEDSPEGDNGGVLLLRQATSFGSTPQFLADGAARNSVDATLVGSSLGAVIQTGTNNTATLALENSRGLIGQFGSGLTASLDVEPAGSGQIIQVGRNSNAQLEVPGGANVTLTQAGNNLTYNQPVQVITANPGNITITQFGF